MAGWGTASFENEDASAWLAKLGTISLDDLTQILVRAAENADYLEAPAASIAVAAAEVVAAMDGSPTAGVPAKVVEWAEKHQQAPVPDLRDLAMRALDRVRRNSELKDLWLEADGLNDWIIAIQELQARLGS